MKRLSLLSFFVMLSIPSFSLDVNAHLNLEGNVANGGTGTSTRFIELNEQGQYDPDACVITARGEKAGGELSFVWTYTSNSTDGLGDTDGDTNSDKPDITIRKASIWFKPTPWSKITVGTLMQHLYREYMRYWMDALPSQVGNKKWMNYREGSGIDYNDSGAGLALALMPVEGLIFEVAAAPGTSSDSDNTSGAWWTWDSDTCSSYLPWGATLKYNITKDISVGTAYADNGLNKYKLLSVGFDYGNPFQSSTYFFIQPRFYFGDKNNSEIQSYGYSRNNTVEEYALTGIAFDNYFKCKITDAVLFQARLPFVLRMSDNKDSDPSYLLYDIELDYNMGNKTPYVEINNCNRIYAPLMFGDEDGYNVKDSFIMDIRPGCKFNFDNVEVNVGVDLYFGSGLENSASYSVHNSNVTKFGFQIPFGINIAL